MFLNAGEGAMEVLDGFSKKGRSEIPIYITAFLSGHALKAIVGTALYPHWQDDRTSRAATEEFVAVLRGLIDQWIDSGKSEQDQSVDEPWKRNVQWTSSAHPRSLAEILLEFRQINPPQLWLGGDGRYLLSTRPMFPTPAGPLEIARVHATQWFVNLLNCSTRERLSRCDGCGAYFVRERMPKKDKPIKLGTFCKGCENKGGAKRTEDSRARRKKKLLKWAADAWVKWTHRRGKRSEWVAEQVNEKLLPLGESIRGNWVTRNQTDIETEVERRNHATRKN
jgi:hypothetical protein